MDVRYGSGNPGFPLEAQVNIFDLSKFAPYLEAETDSGGGGSADGGGDSSDEKPVTFKSQADLDKLIEDRLKRDRAKAKKDLEKEIRDQIDEEKKTEEAKEQGNYKELLEKEQKRVEKLEAKIQELEEGQKAAELAKLRTNIAAKYGIPAALGDRLLGDTEAEIEADAKKVAKEGNFKAADQGGDTEAHKGRKPRLAGEGGGDKEEGQKPKFVFTNPNDVSWAS